MLSRSEKNRELHKRLMEYNEEGLVINVDMYQSMARRTMKEQPSKDELVECALGLAGEAGEVVDIIKKHLYQGHELDENKLVEEIGDVMWYVAGLCTHIGLPISAVLSKNVTKLNKRYPLGFDEERSVHRD